MESSIVFLDQALVLPTQSVLVIANTSSVSWNWGGGAPGGTVAEKKKEGEVSITSKRGNKIKKNAEPSDPAVAIERSGNNVVKKVSELNIEKKAGGSGGGDNKRKKEDDDEEEDKDGGLVENDEGKEVKPGGEAAKKKTKTDKQVNGESKSKAKPKKATESKKNEKKPSKPRDQTSVSSRTRSRN